MAERGALEQLGRQRYVDLATFRRDGREVRTPVWVAPWGDALAIYTNVHSGKIKRLRNSSRARLAPCDVRGAVRGEFVDVTAHVVEDPARRDEALDALVRKYGWQMRVALLASRLTGRYADRAAIRIT